MSLILILPEMRSRHRFSHRLGWNLFGVACLAASLFPLYAEELTVERIYGEPNLTGTALRSARLSPDGSRVSYLKAKPEDRQRFDLWEYDIAGKQDRLLVDSDSLVPGQEILSDEEKARRERKRLFASGIVEYFWAEDGKSLLFPLNGDLYLYDLDSTPDRALRRLTQTEIFETDPRFSPGGNFVSFIREQDLFVINLESGEERQLTADGEGPIKNGMAEFVAQEEMDRFTGYWWSEDESAIAFTRVDESPVPVEQRYEILADSFRVFDQRYPAAGTENVRIQVGVVTLANGKIQWIDIGMNPDIYIARVKWLPDNRRIAIQRESRDQKRLDLLFAEVRNGSSKVVLTERSDHWINLNDDLRFLEKTDRFIWGSERSGFKHLYLYRNDGKLLGPLTGGDWVLFKMQGVDEEKGQIYFTANKDSVLETHLYRADLAPDGPGKAERITAGAGIHGILLSDDSRFYIDAFSSPDIPPRVSLHSIDGKRIVFLNENRLDGTHPFYPYLADRTGPEFGAIQAGDGQDIYYRLYKPANLEAGKKYPVIIDVYGGPRAQRVRRSWPSRNGYWHQIMARKGYVVFSLDNRGSGNRGVAFEKPLYRQLGKVEVEDQAAGIEFLKGLSFVDADRIGVFGWSYGGYMVLMMMMKEPDSLKAGVAVAPVTDWNLYDTHYTERYLGHPEENRSGYEKSNVFPYVENLRGRLFLIHGMADDNVLFTNSTKLYQALQERILPFQMMTYPGSKHSIWGDKIRVHLFQAITEFFDRELKEGGGKGGG